MPGLLQGVLDGGALERRVMRLIDARLPWSQRYRVVSAVCCLAMLSVASVGVTMLSIRPSAAQVAEVEAPKLEVVSVKKVEGRPSMVDQQLTPDGLQRQQWLPLGVLILQCVSDGTQLREGFASRSVEAGAQPRTMHDPLSGRSAKADVASIEPRKGISSKRCCGRCCKPCLRRGPS